MRNAWRLFVNDIKHLGDNVVTVLIVVGLILLPSLFSWYNLLACWDVFNNTGNLTVAVANSDAGYESDLFPVQVNIGDRVISALRENDQLDWVFTDEEDAVDGVMAGRYYAAVVIPQSFSADMLSFFSPDVESAHLVYYSNEKINAIAPKVTDQGAGGIADQVNQVFAETLTDTALALASSLSNYTDQAGIDGALAGLSQHVDTAASRMELASGMLRAYGGIFNAASQAVSDTGKLLEAAQGSAGEVASSVASARGGAQDVASAVEDAVSQLAEAVDSSTNAYSQVGSSIDAAFDEVDNLGSDAASRLRTQADVLEGPRYEFIEIADGLDALADALGEEDTGRIRTLSARMRAASDTQAGLQDALYEAADGIDAAQGASADKREEARALAQSARDKLTEARDGYNTEVKPSLDEVSSALTDASDELSSVGAALDSATGNLVSESGSVVQRVSDTQSKLEEAADALDSSAAELRTLSSELNEALAAGDSDQLRDIIGSDPSVLASALSAPVEIERHAVFPVESFGSAMSPLYTTLALWIGALLAMVTLKMQPGERTAREVPGITPRQFYLGRLGIVTLISLAQSTLMCAGNLFFLGVQAEYPLLYFVCFWVSGLTFAFIIYTCVALLANAGKAIGVVLLIVQVTGGGGSFPLALLPDFVQKLSPFLPIAHSVKAMRAAMFGIYANDFWIELGTLVLFGAPLLIVALLLANTLAKVVPKFLERVEKSKLM